MSDFVFISIVFLVVAAGISAVAFYVKRETRRLQQGRGDDTALGLIKQDLAEIRQEIREAGRENVQGLQNQLAESRKMAQESGRIVKDVTTQLERIHNDHQHVKDLKGQLNKLTDVLSNPKQRGILGEYFLETLLANIFQPNQYKIQYKFKDGETADAVIFVKDKIIPIDAKFSLENYNRILEEKELFRKEELEKIFKNDLKKRIEETSKYIRPQEGTMEFAFMFIPSEGIYYDLLINQVGGIKSNTYDLIEYAFKEKHVIIVSPTSFYAYLQTVLQGLKALQIEESAKEIRKRVGDLQKHLANYDIFMQKLGGSLSTTVNAYNKAHKELGKVDKDIVKITSTEKQIEPLEVEKPNVD